MLAPKHAESGQMPRRRATRRPTDLYLPPLYVLRRITSARVDVGPTCKFLDVNTAAECVKPLIASGISRCGIDILRDKYLAGTDRSDDHLVYFVIDGTVTATSQDYRRLLTAGDLLVSRIDQGLWLQLQPGEHCRGLFFHIYDVERWSSIRNANLLVRRALAPASMDFALQRLALESLSGNFDSNQVGAHYAAIVLLYLDRELADIEEPHARMLRHRLFGMWDRVGKSLHEDWTATRMAAELNVSAGYLHRIVRAYHAVTPMELLRNMRMERAKSLLKETFMTLEAIAAELGYRTAFSFSNVFLATTGKRPGQFRKEAAAKKQA